MYKMYFLCILSILICGGLADTAFHCKGDEANPSSLGLSAEETDWPDIHTDCVTTVKNQIKMELNASLNYLVLGAYFSKDTVNRPGFAKFFYESASEERNHAIKLMEYLTMRGQLTDIKDLITLQGLKTYDVHTLREKKDPGLEALKIALLLEVDVTKSIQKLIKICDDSKIVVDGIDMPDYHIVDWLTAEYLEEQYKAERDLAGKIVTMTKLMKSNEKVLAEFIFDKKLLGIDI